MSKRDNAGSPPAGPCDAEELQGIVEHIIFRADETGYTVCSVMPTGKREAVTLVGACPSLWEGESVRATGRWVRHRAHGYQFQADHIAALAPVSTDGIMRYLASGMVKGIGKVMAQRLVKAFGDDTLRVIDKESGRLLNVDGIGPKRRERIKAAWNEQKAVRDIMVFLHSHRVGTAQASRIYRQYGQEAIARVNENPYRLVRDIWGIGFKTADRIANSLGVAPDSPLRARAGVAYLLHTLTEEGHCFCPRDLLVESAASLLEIPDQVLRDAIEHELAQETLIAEDGNVFLAPLFHAETGAAHHLVSLQQTPPTFKPIDTAKAIAWAESRIRIVFDPTQREALANSLSRKVSVITGGPGVGKTTITRALVDVFRARKLTVCLAAPTGRAAKRLEEATRHRAQTIHRLLKFTPADGGFTHGPDKPLKGDVFILDEVSMVDILLMNAFLRAIPRHACLVLIGDVDQLPSVGPGNVLRDLIESGAVPFVRLQTIFRQGDRSWIVHNAHLVNAGRDLELPRGRELADFYFIETAEPDEVVSRVLHLVKTRIPARFRLDPRKSVQVLSPMRRNQLGADNLNTQLQQALNPTGVSTMRFGRVYRVGDRVMQLRNNYDKDVFNGDIGAITSVNEVDRELSVAFDDRIVNYDFGEMDELSLAYASSIHKAQGSEYPAVVIVLATQHFKLLQRNLLYTAITRGRRLVCLVGSTKAVRIATANNRILLRRTGLRDRLQRLMRS
ncbi:MAG: ATP-dependent RecD-like DNA helicase [Kiritimatiellae bacterium]|nr:ATP-dependent RecD-like DNA helicase [Kiritimatiellia bacterium]